MLESLFGRKPPPPQPVQRAQDRDLQPRQTAQTLASAKGFLKLLEPTPHPNKFKFNMKYFEFKKQQQLLAYAEQPNAPPIALIPIAMINKIQMVDERDFCAQHKNGVMRMRAPTPLAAQAWVDVLQAAIDYASAVRASDRCSPASSRQMLESLDSEAEHAVDGDTFADYGVGPDDASHLASISFSPRNAGPIATATNSRSATPIASACTTIPSSASTVKTSSSLTIGNSVSLSGKLGQQQLRAMESKSEVEVESHEKVKSQSSAHDCADDESTAQEAQLLNVEPPVREEPQPQAQEDDTRRAEKLQQRDKLLKPPDNSLIPSRELKSQDDSPERDGSLRRTPIASTKPNFNETSLSFRSHSTIESDVDMGCHDIALSVESRKEPSHPSVDLQGQSHESPPATPPRAESERAVPPWTLVEAVSHYSPPSTEKTRPRTAQPLQKRKDANCSTAERLYRSGVEKIREQLSRGSQALDLDDFGYGLRAGVDKDRYGWISGAQKVARRDVPMERSLAAATFSPSLSSHSVEMAKYSPGRAQLPWWERHYRATKTDDDIAEMQRRADVLAGKTYSPTISPFAASLRRHGKIEERLQSEWLEMLNWRDEQLESKNRAQERKSQELRRERLERINVAGLVDVSNGKPVHLRLYEQAVITPRGQTPPGDHSPSVPTRCSSARQVTTATDPHPSVFERLHQLSVDEEQRRQGRDREESELKGSSPSSNRVTLTDSIRAELHDRLYDRAKEIQRKKEKKVQQVHKLEREKSAGSLRATAAALEERASKMHEKAMAQRENLNRRSEQTRQAVDEEIADKVFRTVSREPISSDHMGRLYEEGMERQRRRSLGIQLDQQRRHSQALEMSIPEITGKAKRAQGRAVPEEVRKSLSLSPTPPTSASASYDSTTNSVPVRLFKGTVQQM